MMNSRVLIGRYAVRFGELVQRLVTGVAPMFILALILDSMFCHRALAEPKPIAESKPAPRDSRFIPRLDGTAPSRLQNDGNPKLASPVGQTRSQTMAELKRLTAAIRENLGNADYDEALKLTQQARQIFGDAFGRHHTKYAAVTDSLATQNSHLGNYTRAIELGYEARTIERELLPPIHPRRTACDCVLGTTYRMKGDLKRSRWFMGCVARDWLLRSAGRWFVDIPEENEIALSYYCLQFGHLSLDLADYEGAKAFLHAGAVIAGDMWGTQNEDYARFLVPLAQADFELADYEAATKTLTTAKEMIPDHHPDYARCLMIEGQIHWCHGEWAEAQGAFKDARKIIESAFDARHPTYAVVLIRFAELANAQGKPEEAIKCCREALDILTVKTDGIHPDCASALTAWAMAHLAKSDFNEGLDKCKRALDVLRESVGTEHPRYAKTLRVQARLYLAKGQHAKAEPLLRQAIRIQEEKLGKQHPELVETRKLLDSLERKEG